MANKYIRHGETFNGDGTSSAAATANGGVGAWNNLNVFEGTAPAYGALAAGDVVYIRSKDAGGADITRTISANSTIGASSATAGAPITWAIDNGAVWPGINGVVKYVRSNSSAYVSVLANNLVVALTQDALLFDDADKTWPGAEFIRLSGSIKNGRFLSGDTNTSLPIVASFAASGKPAVLENPTLRIARGNGGRVAAAASQLRIINPSIEMLGTQSGQSVFYISSEWGPSQIEVFGGKIFGAGASSNTSVFQIYESGYGSTKCLAYGTSIPRSMPVSNYAFSRSGRIEMVGLDGGIGSHLEEVWGWATSRTDNNPPVIEATLPDGNLTKWAWRVYPKAADYQKPVRLPSLKMFTDTAAIKTVTLEFLLANTFSAATKKNTWATVQYTDAATGEPKSVSTQDITGSALDVSAATWSAATWGTITLAKKKLSVTTPTTIKQNTPVFVTFYCALTSASDQDILFVDSDFSIA